jgi:hypothetical protein
MSATILEIDNRIRPMEFLIPDLDRDFVYHGGLGRESGQDNIKLMQCIEVLGVAEMTNVNNGSQLFTILRGGIVDVTNNSNVHINPGDWIQAYPPSREELSQGGKGKREDRNCEAKLWFKPYDHVAEALKPKQIYDCLKSNKEEDYSSAYWDSCKKFKSAILDMALVVINTNYDAITKLSSDKSKRIQELTKLSDEIAKNEQTMEDLFYPYSKKGQLIDQTKTNNSLNKKQVEGMDTFLASVSRLQYDKQKNIIGKAMHGAAPKKDVSLHLCGYALK